MTSAKINTSITTEQTTAFFSQKITPEIIHTFFQDGFPSTLLENNLFIYHLKIKALEDEQNAILLIDYAADHLPKIINQPNHLHALIYSLSEKVLSHLLSKADFILKEFISTPAAFFNCILNTDYSKQRSLFLAKHYQTHFFFLLKNKFSVGLLTKTLALIIKIESSQNSDFISNITNCIHDNALELFKNQDITPLISNLSSSEFTLLIQSIPACFEILTTQPIKPTLFSSLILYEKLNTQLQTHFRLLLFKNLISQAKQPAHHPSAFFHFKADENELVFLKKIEDTLNDNDKSDLEKELALTNIISIEQDNNSISKTMEKMLTDRNLLAKNDQKTTALSF